MIIKQSLSEIDKKSFIIPQYNLMHWYFWVLNVFLPDTMQLYFMICYNSGISA